MSVNIGMKFTLDTNRSVTKTLTQIRSMPSATTATTATTTSRVTMSRFSMTNLGRTPQLSLNNFSRAKPKGGCGCCGG